MTSIPTFIINVEGRTERNQHRLKQFKNNQEFAVQIVKAVENKNGALGLWQTVVHCGDNHQFTKYYNKEMLYRNIEEALRKNADILLGGVSWLNDTLQIDENLYQARE